MEFNFGEELEQFKKQAMKSKLEDHNPKQKEISEDDPHFKRVYIINGIRFSGNLICTDWIRSHLNGSAYPDQDIVLNIEDSKMVTYPSKSDPHQEYLIINHQDRRQLPLLYDVSRFGPNTKVYNVSVLRTPRNNLTSLMECETKGKVNEENFASYWCDYYQMFKELEIPGVVCASLDYDLWISSKDYRDQLAKQLDFDNRELQDVSYAEVDHDKTDATVQKVMKDLRDEIKIRGFSSEEYFSKLVI